jgi:hypothetical protein
VTPARKSRRWVETAAALTQYFASDDFGDCLELMDPKLRKCALPSKIQGIKTERAASVNRRAFDFVTIKRFQMPGCAG